MRRVVAHSSTIRQSYDAQKNQSVFSHQAQTNTITTTTMDCTHSYSFRSEIMLSFDGDVQCFRPACARVTRGKRRQTRAFLLAGCTCSAPMPVTGAHAHWPSAAASPSAERRRRGRLMDKELTASRRTLRNLLHHDLLRPQNIRCLTDRTSAPKAVNASCLVDILTYIYV